MNSPLPKKNNTNSLKKSAIIEENKILSNSQPNIIKKTVKQNKGDDNEQCNNSLNKVHAIQKNNSKSLGDYKTYLKLIKNAWLSTGSKTKT